MINILKDKKCKSFIDVGHLDPDGTMPSCMGTACSIYHQCNLSEMQALVDLDKLSRSASGKRVLKDLEEL